MKTGLIVDLLKMPLYEGIKKSGELGVDGIQVYAESGICNLFRMSDAELRELNKRCGDNGLEISAVCGDLGGHGFQIQEENTKKIKQTKQIIDIAKKLNCRIITSHIGVIPSNSSDKVYDVMRSALAEIGDYAFENGAFVAIETGPETANVLNKFIEDTGSKGVKVNLDPANLVMVLDEDPVKAVEILKKHIVHTHAKDGIHYRKCDPVKVYDAFAEGGFEKLLEETGQLFAEVPLGEGQVKWDAYLSALKKIGFDGFLTIEREVGANPLDDITKAISFLKNKI